MYMYAYIKFAEKKHSHTFMVTLFGSIVDENRLWDTLNKQ